MVFGVFYAFCENFCLHKLFCYFCVLVNLRLQLWYDRNFSKYSSGNPLTSFLSHLFIWHNFLINHFSSIQWISNKHKRHILIYFRENMKHFTWEPNVAMIRDWQSARTMERRCHQKSFFFFHYLKKKKKNMTTNTVFISFVIHFWACCRRVASTRETKTSKTQQIENILYLT